MLPRIGLIKAYAKNPDEQTEWCDKIDNQTGVINAIISKDKWLEWHVLNYHFTKSSSTLRE